MAPSLKTKSSVAVDLSHLHRRVVLREDEFQALAELISSIAGIHLSPHKAPMVESRLYKRLRVLGLNSFSEYLERVQNDGHEQSEFVNALTTNKTEFFREPFHFEFLTDTIVRECLKKSRSDRINVWCAAASTGEEPYTLAMVLTEALRGSEADFRILATDIDTDVLKKAERGVYRQDQVEAVRPELLQRYFMRGIGPNHGHFKVKPELTQKIKFRRFNLIADNLTSDIRFDVIFLRNVLIYFQPDRMKIVIDKLTKRLRPGGYLIIGHSETLNRIPHKLQALHSAIYRNGNG